MQDLTERVKIPISHILDTKIATGYCYTQQLVRSSHIMKICGVNFIALELYLRTVYNQSILIKLYPINA